MGSLNENRKSFWAHFRISNAPKFFNLVQYLQTGQIFISELVFKQKFGLIFAIYTPVDPLTSILAVLARSCQILTTSWQLWIPWQDSY